MGGICLNWGCIPTKALLRSAEIYHYMNHAKDYGLVAEKIGFDAAAIVQRSRGVSGRLNGGIGMLMKKNKIDVIWGEASISKPGEVVVSEPKKARRAAADAAAEGHARRWNLSGQAHHRRDRRAAACAARNRAGRKTDLDLFRGHEARGDAEIAPRHGLGRHGRPGGAGQVAPHDVRAEQRCDRRGRGGVRAGRGDVAVLRPVDAVDRVGCLERLRIGARSGARSV